MNQGMNIHEHLLFWRELLDFMVRSIAIFDDQHFSFDQYGAPVKALKCWPGKAERRPRVTGGHLKISDCCGRRAAHRLRRWTPGCREVAAFHSSSFFLIRFLYNIYMIYMSFSKRTPRVSLRKKKTPFEHHFWLELWSSAFETWSLCNLILILALFSCVRDEAFGCLGFQCVDGSCMGQQGAFSDAAVLPETLFAILATGPQGHRHLCSAILQRGVWWLLVPLHSRIDGEASWFCALNLQDMHSESEMCI